MLQSGCLSDHVADTNRMAKKYPFATCAAWPGRRFDFSWLNDCVYHATPALELDDQTFPAQEKRKGTLHNVAVGKLRAGKGVCVISRDDQWLVTASTSDVVNRKRRSQKP
jgi:hypothetical protein